MNLHNKYLHEIRQGAKGSNDVPAKLTAVCDRTGKKIASGDCVRNCPHFAGVDYETIEVICWRA